MPLNNPGLTISADVRNQATESDYILMIDSQGTPYKIAEADLFAGLSSGFGASGTTNNVVFLSSFNSIVDAKGHQITVVGNPMISTDQSKFDGTSIYFDGDGDYLLVNASNDWNLGFGDFIIETWLYPTARRSDNGKDNVFASTAIFNSSGWQLEVNSGTTGGNKAISFFIGQYQNRIFVDDPEWLDSWKYVAIRRLNGIIQIWIDGVLKKSAPYPYDATNTEPLVIGRAGLGWDATDFWKGYCAGLKITNLSPGSLTVPLEKFTA